VLSPCSSFNSLSRDHLRRRRRCAPVRTRNLSTPSLGITDLVDAVAYAVKELYAFNSLSRDHAHREARLPSCDSLRGTFNSLSRDHDDIIGDVAVYRKDFQLPLSGSLSGWPPPSPSRPMRLSTPSLGITEQQDLATLLITFDSFNSLSRDHTKPLAQPHICVEKIFQLPLSGSQRAR